MSHLAKRKTMRIAKILLLITSIICPLAALTPANDPMSIEMFTPESPVRSGSKIIVRLMIKNESNQEVTYHDTRRDCDYIVNVFRSNGGLAPDTEYKKQLKCSTGFLLTGRDIVVSLKPGESHEDHVDVSRLKDMRSPDVYSIQISRSFGQLGTFTSNTATVTVGN